MQHPIVAPHLQWDEITRGLTTTSKELLGKLSVRSIVSQSWVAGGVYPTLLGYALGAIATFALCGGSHWTLRFPPAVLCAVVLVQTLVTMESAACVFLLAFAALVGVGCTYVQVLSWKEAFASVTHRRKMNKNKKNYIKVDKED